VLALLFVLSAGRSSGSPEPGADQLFFSKSFPGSRPEYFEVTVNSAGKAEYREDSADDPLQFVLRSSETRQIFDLAEKLARFQKPLQVDRKVAFTGKKTLRYVTAAGEESATEFTFSADENAQSIVQWFEKIGETERHRAELERAVRFDPLGVNKALLLFQASFDSNRVVASQQFLPILTAIAKESKFMHMARARAASLVERIEGQNP
jgi:hypothetical protein